MDLFQPDIFAGTAHAGDSLPNSLWSYRGGSIFDRAQFEEVVAVCRRSRNLSEAGRTLSVPRQKRSSTNDPDRLRKYLAMFDLSWDDVSP